MPKMTRRRYTEAVLDVHGVFERADTLWEDHRLLTDSVNLLSKTVREIEAEIEAREIFLIEDLTPNTVEMSTTAAKDFIRAQTRLDEDHRHLTDRIARARADREAAEGHLRHAELGCRMLAARMHELGGLLFFYGPPDEDQSEKSKSEGNEENDGN